MELLDEYKAGQIVMPPERCVRDEHDESQLIPILEWVATRNKIHSNSIMPNLFQLWKVKRDLKRYVVIRRSFFGEHMYGLPPKPSPEQLEKLLVPFLSFLETYELTALIPLMTLAVTAQGYGRLEDVSAFYGLWWVSDDLVRGYLEKSTHKTDTTLMIDNGYQALWEQMAVHHEMDIRFNSHVIDIRRNMPGDFPVQVTVDDPLVGRAVYSADFLIVACPQMHLLHAMTDQTTDEQIVFGSLRTFALEVTLRLANPNMTTKYMTVYNMDSILSKTVHHEHGPDEIEIGTRVTEIALKLDEPQHKMHAVQYTWFADEKTMHHTKPHSSGDVIQTCRWEYFPHFDSDGLRAGHPWNILHRQGLMNTWHIGSSCCFESVEDCTSYNKLIVKFLLDIHDE
jgi:hypothetical protein